jgi:hypothetical protein
MAAAVGVHDQDWGVGVKGVGVKGVGVKGVDVKGANP